MSSIRTAEGCTASSTCTIKNTYTLDNCTLDFTSGIVQALVMGTGSVNGIFNVTGTNTIKANGITLTARGQINGTGATITLDANGQAMAINRSGSTRGRVTLVTNSASSATAGAVYITAGSLSVDGRLESVPQVDTGTHASGTIDVTTTTGGVSINSGAVFGVEGAANGQAGALSIDAAGDVTIVPNFAVRAQYGGDITISASGTGSDITISGSVDASARSNGGYSGGTMTLEADGSVQLAAVSLRGRGSFSDGSCNYAYGGTLDATAGGLVNLTGAIDLRGDNAGSGGTITVDAGSSITVGATINAEGSSCHGEVDAGGEITMTADTGDITVNGILDAAGPGDISGYGITLTSNGGNITVNASLLATGDGDIGAGAQVTLDAAGDVDVNAAIDTSGGINAAGDITVYANRSISIDNTVNAKGLVAGNIDDSFETSSGGAISLSAGFSSFVGDIAINAIVDASGSGCAGTGDDKVCGSGGTVDLDACNVTVTSLGHIRANGDDGTNRVIARQNLAVHGEVSAVKVTGGFSNGTNDLDYVSALDGSGATYAPAVGSGTTLAQFAACYQAGQSSCIVTCPGCTTSPVGGTGTALQNGAACTDAQFCNGQDTCNAGSCGQHAGNPCSGGAECNNSCNEAADNCRVASGTACTDDGNGCTNDQCNGLGACTHPNNTASCSDGLFCNGNDTCSGGSCSQHAGNPCTGGAECNNSCNEAADNCRVASGTACTDDGNGCTNDQCNGLGSCAHPNNTAPCSDGLFCNGSDTCSGGSCSSHAGDPCSGGAECSNSCNESVDNCLVASGTACTDDGNGCTNDQCNGLGSCAHPNNTAPCSDGLFCNGSDTCSGGSCSSHAGDPCSGGAECENSCNETADNCHTSSGTACSSDDNLCTADACDGAGACAHADISASCDDADSCTEDTCDAETGCQHEDTCELVPLRLVRTITAPAVQGFFGASLAALDSSRVIIGAPFDWSSMQTAGAAYIYDIETGSQLQAYLNPAPEENGLFGFSVAALGGDVVVGAPQNDVSGTENAGLVYVFDTGSTTPTATYQAQTLSENGRFGYGVGVLGTDLLVSHVTPSLAFRIDPSTSGITTYTQPSPQDGKWGNFIMPIGTHVAVGDAELGSVFLFDAATGTHERTLTASGLMYGFMFAGADSGGELVLGGTSGAPGEGTIDFYDPDDGTLLRSIANPDSGTAWWAFSVAVAGPRVIASGADGNGSLSVFELATGTLLQTIANTDTSSYVFGWAMIAVGNSVVVGAPYGDGATYIYTPCGDGHLDAGETCDDGNLDNGDCCSDTCQIEPLSCGP